MKTRICICILTGVLFAIHSSWASSHERIIKERAYLQTDKNTYLAGELLWTKMYITDPEGIPVSFSKTGYIEVLDTQSAVLQAKIDLTDGTGEGCLEIPATLPTGYYRLVAYTRNMRNEGEEIYFNKLINVINTFKTDEEIAVVNDTILQDNSFRIPENTIMVSPEKQIFHVRSAGKIELQGLPENIHSMAISIAGKDLIIPEGTTHINHWKQQLGSLPVTTYSGKYVPEYEGHIVSGKAINLQDGTSSIPEKITPLLGFVGDQLRIFGGHCNENGEVTFVTKRIGGMPELVTTALSPSNNRYRIDIESPYSTHSEKELPGVQLNEAWKEQLLQRSVGLQVLYSYMADSLSQMEKTDSYFQWQPDWSYLLDEYTRFTTMEEVVIEFVIGLRFRRINNKRILSVLTEDRTGFTIGNSLVLLDGIPITDHELIFNYNPLLIRQIEVYKGKFVFGGQLVDGIASFKTYNLDYPGLTLDNSTQFFDYEGTLAKRTFHAPSYPGNHPGNRIPDYRHTLLWQPEVQTGGQRTVSIPFTTSDIQGNFNVVVEGMTKDGKPIYGMASFEVN
ncbi:MAG: hypothetical protein LUG51_06250 [Tannerellaceae bacterium]|nr:hypothetical protein [Tannerellaceae bacterium]